MTSAPVHVLVVLSEPPPTSSGLGTSWAKLAMGAATPEFALDFMGPDPGLCSNGGPSGLPVEGRLYGIGAPPLARRASLRRNRQKGLARFLWSSVRAPFALWERATGRQMYSEWLDREIQERLRNVLAEMRYTAVAVMATSIGLAEVVQRCCQEARVPLVLVIGDPLGRRDDSGGFEPATPDRQESLIRDAAVFVTTESAFQRYYSRCFALDPQRVAFIQDSFVPMGRIQEAAPAEIIPETSFLHWGQIDPWRPVDTFVQGLAAWNAGRPSGSSGALGLAVMGPVIEERMRRLASLHLGPLFTQHPPGPYLQARAVARTARRFVVLVSHRHRDNVPSKLIDSLAYGRPILLLAHPDSAAAELVRQFGVGVVADIRDAGSVTDAIDRLERERVSIERSFENPELESAWGYEGIGARFREGLLGALALAQR